MLYIEYLFSETHTLYLLQIGAKKSKVKKEGNAEHPPKKRTGVQSEFFHSEILHKFVKVKA